MVGELQEYCAIHQLELSVFVDDIAFSGPDVRPHVGPVIELVRKHRFAVRSKKVNVAGRNDCQHLLGLVVNEVLGVGRVRLQKARDEILAMPVSAESAIETTI